MTSLRLARGDAAILAAHLTRLTSWEAAGPVRLVVRPNALGVYAAPPMGVLVFTAVPLAEAAEDADRTCAAASFRDALALAAAGGEETVEVALPDAVPGTADLTVLPPAEGWHLPIHAVSGDLVPLVEGAVTEFKARAAASPAMSQAIAAEIWDRPAWAGLPVRVLHCARILGFLPQDASRVAASTAGPWKRFSTGRGQVFLRVDAGPPGLTLLPPL